MLPNNYPEARSAVSTWPPGCSSGISTHTGSGLNGVAYLGVSEALAVLQIGGSPGHSHRCLLIWVHPRRVTADVFVMARRPHTNHMFCKEFTWPRASAPCNGEGLAPPFPGLRLLRSRLAKVCTAYLGTLSGWLATRRRWMLPHQFRCAGASA